MDALSLSHLTYCCATITVNFHRLDHPPFPCKSRLLLIRTADKTCRKGSAIHRVVIRWHLLTCAEKVTPHEASHPHRNSSHRSWHHWIRHRRNLYHPQEKGRRRGPSPDLPQNAGYPSSLADLQHDFACSRRRFGCVWGKDQVNPAEIVRVLLIFKPEDKSSHE
jgi:hypothetical protein